MKTNTFSISAVALAAALSWHQAGHAAATESQLRSITLYGNVSIQDDSTGSWGPWAEFEPTAAGNTPPAAFPRGANDPYRPLAQTGGTTTTPPQAEPGCVAGGLCGFGAFQAAGDPNNETIKALAGSVQDIHPIRMDGTILQGPGAESGYPYLPQSIELATTELATGSFLLPNSGPLDLQSGEGVYYERRANEANDFFSFIPQTFPTYFDPEEVQATFIFGGEVGRYVQGSPQSQNLIGVIGYATGADQMSALRASNAQATYRGNDYYGSNVVAMTVNFGNATWSGTWNGGGDGTVYQQPAASGGTVLYGQVGFTAAGTVQGANFRSTSVGTTDQGATISGYVQGAFYGPNAAAAGGVVDITKTMPATQQQQQPSGGRATAAGVVQAGQGYSGRYVAPFLAVRSDLIRNRD